MEKIQTLIKVKQEAIGDRGTRSLYVHPDVKDIDEPKNFGGPLPKFKWLCENLLKNLARISTENRFYSTTSKYDRKVTVIRQFITEWRTTVGPNIFPALVLILPKRDKSRIYGMKDLTLGRYLLKILRLSKTSPDAQMVNKWKQNYNTKQQQMSNICIELIKKRQADQKGGKLTIGEVNDILDLFASSDADAKIQVELLTKCLDTMCFIELKYFFDILLKLRVDQGMENTLLNIWHPDAVQYLSVVTSLKTVAYKLYDPTKRLKASDLTINLCKPFAPQLSKKPNYSYLKIVERFNKDFYVEEKLDGERIQIHFQNYGEVIKYWSRKATDYTYLYGGPKGEGCISKHLKFINSVKSCVLDGEMIVYDPVRKQIVPFGVLKGIAIEEQKRAFENEQTEQPRPLFVAFDLLYLNGVSLASYPLFKRKKMLKQVLQVKEGFVEVIESTRFNDEQSIKKGLERAIEHGAEGIVVKQAKSKYYVDERSDSWLKLKPEYFEEFGENVDLIVIGREKSKKDHYYCGLRETSNDTETEKKCKFWCFCRVSNGFDHEDYKKINNMTEGKWHDYETEIPPTSLLEFGKRVPAEWIDPRESLVIEIKARSIDRSVSKNYRSSTTLYNAYKRFIRDDKDWRSATTLDEYKEIRDARKSVNSDNHKLLTKKKQIANKRKREEKDEEVWKADDKDQKISTLFEGITFMVLSDCFYEGRRYSIDELFKMIHKNSGKTTKNQNRVTNIPNLRIISDKAVALAKALRDEGFDILKSSWLFDCLTSHQIIKHIEPKHCFLVSEVLNEKSLGRVDDSGLSYVTVSPLSTVKKVFENCSKLEEKEMSDRFASLDLKKELTLFGGLKCYVVSDLENNFEQRLIKLKLRTQGGIIVDEFEEYGKYTCNLIIVCNEEEVKVMREVKRIRKRLADIAENNDYQTIRMVNSRWVYASIKEHIQVDPQDYPMIHNRELVKNKSNALGMDTFTN